MYGEYKVPVTYIGMSQLTSEQWDCETYRRRV